MEALKAPSFILEQPLAMVWRLSIEPGRPCHRGRAERQRCWTPSRFSPLG